MADHRDGEGSNSAGQDGAEQSRKAQFDKAEQDIASIRRQSKETRQNLEGMRAATADNFSIHDLPKSKNIFSHLTSSNAMLDYQIQNARSLVRKQEDLLRHLGRMRENMERSDSDIEKCRGSLDPVAASKPVRREPADSAKQEVVIDHQPSAVDLESGQDGDILGAELSRLKLRIANILGRAEVSHSLEADRRQGPIREALYSPAISSGAGLPHYSDPYGDYAYSVTYFPESYGTPASRYSRPYYADSYGDEGAYSKYVNEVEQRSPYYSYLSDVDQQSKLTVQSSPTTAHVGKSQ